MAAFVSRPVDQGHLVVAELGDTAIGALFVGEDTPRDITHWFADLVLLGLGVRNELDNGETLEPAESVEVCQVAVVGDHTQISVIYVHHPTLVAVTMDTHDALSLAALGISAQITAGVAYDEAHASADLDNPPAAPASPAS